MQDSHFTHGLINTAESGCKLDSHGYYFALLVHSDFKRRRYVLQTASSMTQLHSETCFLHTVLTLIATNPFTLTCGLFRCTLRQWESFSHYAPQLHSRQSPEATQISIPAWKKLASFHAAVKTLGAYGQKSANS